MLFFYDLCKGKESRFSVSLKIFRRKMRRRQGEGAKGRKGEGVRGRKGEGEKRRGGEGEKRR
jgi:hypothetical protein